MGKKKKKTPGKGHHESGAASHQHQHNPQGMNTIAATSTTAPLMECEICNESFDTESRKPRNLECGHSFCTSCCKGFEERRTFCCPKCRKRTVLNDSDKYLPVNYPVLDVVSSLKSSDTNHQTKDPAKKPSSPHGGKCLEAKAKLHKYCARCDLWLCKVCSLMDHQRPNCLLKPFQETLDKMKKTGLTKVKGTETNLQMFSGEGKAYREKLGSFATFLEKTLECVQMEQSHLKEILDQSKKMEQEMCAIGRDGFPDELDEALAHLDLLEGTTNSAKQWTADVSAMFRKGHYLSMVSKKLLYIAVQLHMTDDSSQASTKVVALHSIKGISVILPLEMYKGSVLIHAVRQQDPPPGSVVVKMEHIRTIVDNPRPRVFLDISQQGQKIGRVYIRLLGYLKRSYCFLMMCTGMAGPSYRGTRFHRMWWAGQHGEHMWGGDHDHGDGSGGKIPDDILNQSKDMSDNETSIAVTAGLVAVGYDKNSTIFRVYLSHDSNRVEGAAIGHVEDGLNVLKNAIKNTNNITDITISGCGLVCDSSLE